MDHGGWWACFAVLLAAAGWLRFASIRDASAQAGEPLALRGFRWRYLRVFLLFKAADWMQGPFFYDVYDSKVDPATGLKLFSSAEISLLFLSGFLSAMVFGTFVGSLADRWGRRSSALLCGALGLASCLCVHASTTPILAAGRFFGGMFASLLHTTLESWMLSELGRTAAAAKIPAEDADAYLSRLFSLQVRHAAARGGGL
jgi:MFS family permease